MMAAHVATVVAGPSRAAFEGDREVLTSPVPQLSRKRKQPSLDTLMSTDALYGRAINQLTPETTPEGTPATTLSSVTEPEAVPEVVPEVPVGCFCALKAKLKSLFSK